MVWSPFLYTTSPRLGVQYAVSAATAADHEIDKLSSESISK